MRNWIVKAEGQETFYGVSDTSGRYEITIDTGDYVVSIKPYSYWDTCQSYTVSATNFYDTTELDIPLQTIADCPWLEVDISTSFLRLCDDRTYTVQYCNYGTVAADSTSIQVVLDSGLTYSSATAPLISQNGQTLLFDGGSLAVSECKTFYITVSTPCDSAFLGSTLCAEAHIFPDSICQPVNWNGAQIALEIMCMGDSVQFSIINNGQAMMEAAGYIVIEDNLIMMQGNFELGNGEDTVFKVFAATPAPNAATYHLLAAQDLAMPKAFGNAMVTASYEGCNGPVNSGTLLNFPESDGQPFLSIDCHTVVGSWDPNDKSASPTGWKDEHFIDRTTDLEYHIRFQNTGTDTAFKVVIVDTLSEHLDPTTLRVGASSHPYSYDLTGNGVVRFIFDPIILPDSNVNEAASHGFVKFRISQQANLPIGTVIYNDAAIYFDQNPPVITNEIFHTIGEEQWVKVISSSKEVFVPHVNFEVFPNPATHYLNVQLENTNIESGQYAIYDMQGRQITQRSFANDRFEVGCDHLQSGMYVLRIASGIDGKVIGSVKFVVQR